MMAAKRNEGDIVMLTMFKARKSEEPVFRFSNHPAFFSILLPAAALWLAVIKAYLFSNLSVLAELRPPSTPESASSDNWFLVMVGHPWQALLIGCLVGALMTLKWNRYQWKHAEEIAKLRITPRGLRSVSSFDRRFGAVFLAFLVTGGALAVLCYALRISFAVAPYGLLIAQCLSYRVNAHIYKLTKNYYEAALDTAGSPKGPIRPSHAWKAGFAVFFALFFGSLIVFSFRVIRMAPMMNELDLESQSIAGFELPPAQAVELEDRLVRNQEDIMARARLVGYYGARLAHSRTAETAVHLRSHLLWLIEHHPESFVGIPTEFSPKHNEGDTAPLLEAERLWRKQIELHPKNTAVLSHASDFFYYAKDDLPEAIELMQRCLTLEPRNERWITKMGHLRTTEGRKK